MKFYSYTAVTAEGKAISGALEAMDEATVEDILAQRGLYPVRINSGSALWGNFTRFLPGRSVKRIEVIEFAQNLSVMLRAGISIMSALSDITETTSNPAFKEILHDVRQSVERGDRFTDAVERYGSVFPGIFISLVRVGEETGQFETSLAEIAEHLKKVDEVSAAIKQAMIYPVFAITTTFGALMFWLIYVLPKVMVTFKGLGGKVPLLTRSLMAASDFSRKYWFLYLLIPAAAGILFQLLKRKELFCYQLDRIKLQLPVVKDLLYYKIIALFAEQMHIQIRSGLTIDKSLSMVAEVIGNEYYRQSLLRVKETVILGGFVSETLKTEKIYPPLLVRMISVGETSGTLETQLAFLADHYFKKLDNLSANLGKIVEPVAIIMVGLIFAVVILGLILPIYGLVSQVGGGRM
ncbi:MAG: type II secretion system F family protein [Geobacter sp.]|nr:type II secretion system F family protein [Geobacter sp.]